MSPKQKMLNQWGQGQSNYSGHFMTLLCRSIVAQPPFGFFTKQYIIIY